MTHEQEQEFYKLKTHETMRVGKIEIIKVETGWIYNFIQGGEVFVPSKEHLK